MNNSEIHYPSLVLMILYIGTVLFLIINDINGWYTIPRIYGEVFAGLGLVIMLLLSHYGSKNTKAIMHRFWLK